MKFSKNKRILSAVLGLSLSYLPLSRIACSLLSVMLSGKLIGMIQRWGHS